MTSINNDTEATQLQKQQIQELIQQGKFTRAATLCRQYCENRSADAEAWFLLGAIQGQLGDFSGAEDSCRRSVELQPNHAGLHRNLAVTLQQQGKPAAAIEALQRSVELAPNFAEAQSDLATLLLAQRRFDEAREQLELSLNHLPENAGLHYQLAAVLIHTNHAEEGLTACRRVLELAPGHIEARCACARALRITGRLAEAGQILEALLEEQPAHAEARALLAGISKDQGRVDMSIRHYREAVAVAPERNDLHSNLLFIMNYSDSVSTQEQFQEARQWAARYGREEAGKLSTGPVNRTEQPLRVGYVSADFRMHSVAYFIEPVLEHHDRKRVVSTCYADLGLYGRDTVTTRIAGKVGQWRDITAMSDADLAAQIRADGIDILVDLAGHTAGNRLRMFALRPAPLMVNWIGYPNTTGLSCMDYRLTDALADPDDGRDRHYTERLIRMDDGFLCYRPADEAPPVAVAPCVKNQFVTFGSFNNLAKVTPDVVQAWAAILQASPGSRLVIKQSVFADVATRTRTLNQFIARGMDVERIELRPAVPSMREHLAAYSEIDIALDTFPYNGTTTTCEALWMGVPVITLAGLSHAGRVGLDLLSRVGVAELVTASSVDYIRLACQLAGDQQRITAYRASLRDRMAASVLCDAPRFARKIEDCYTVLWQQHRRTHD